MTTPVCLAPGDRVRRVIDMEIGEVGYIAPWELKTCQNWTCGIHLYAEVSSKQRQFSYLADRDNPYESDSIITEGLRIRRNGENEFVVDTSSTSYKWKSEGYRDTDWVSEIGEDLDDHIRLAGFMRE
jgi:hypothetical protein